MTSKLTREERVQSLYDLKTGQVLNPSDIENIKMLARMALAAMDSEPVAVIDQANLDYLRSGADADVWPPEREEMGDVLLYRHVQPARVVPDKMNYQDGVLFVLNNDMSSIERGTVAMRAWNQCRAAMLNGGKS